MSDHCPVVLLLNIRVSVSMHRRCIDVFTHCHHSSHSQCIGHQQRGIAVEWPRPRMTEGTVYYVVRVFHVAKVQKICKIGFEIFLEKDQGGRENGLHSSICLQFPLHYAWDINPKMFGPPWCMVFGHSKYSSAPAPSWHICHRHRTQVGPLLDQAASDRDY